MNGLKEALEYAVELREPEIFEFEGRSYSDKPLTRVDNLSADTIHIRTLTGIVDYLKDEIDKDKMSNKIFINIIDYDEVKITSELKNDLSRDIFIHCENRGIDIPFNRFVDREMFNIILQSCFVQNEDSQIVLSYIGNMTDNTVRAIGDDGVSQEVSIKQATKGVVDVIIPNPVELIPYRTFTDIDQPESRFIFRVNERGECALFEADGGAWKNTAMQSIVEFFKEQLSDIDINIIA